MQFCSIPGMTCALNLTIYFSYYALISVLEDPPGTFRGLEDGETYWVYVSQDSEEERKDKERMKKVDHSL